MLLGKPAPNFKSRWLSFPRKRESTATPMNSLLDRPVTGLPHKHGNEFTSTGMVTRLVCANPFAGLTAACVRMDSRFRGNDMIGEGIDA